MPRLANQPWIVAARKVIDALDAVRPGCARFVGGCVRNALLDEPVADVDIATQLTPDLVEKACRNAGMAVHPTGIEHGTLTVVSANVPYEVTTLRRDVETDGRRATVSFTHDWAEDAQRRDFRMNALYADRVGEILIRSAAGWTTSPSAASSSLAMPRPASARTTCASCVSSASRPGTALPLPIRTASQRAASFAAALMASLPSASGWRRRSCWVRQDHLLRWKQCSALAFLINCFRARKGSA